MKRSTFILSLALAGLWLAAGCGQKQPQIEAIPFDQFLQRAAQTEAGDRQALVDAYLQATDTIPKPFVQDTLATFVYLGQPSAPPRVPGGFNLWNPDSAVMVGLEGTNLYYYQHPFPRDARVEYKYQVDGQMVLDTLNKRTILSTTGINSELAMPQYQSPPEIDEHPDLAHGEMTAFRFTSDLLKTIRNVRLYLPPDYAAGTDSLPSIYVLGGNDYLTLADMDNVLDYCIANQQCRPTVGVFVEEFAGDSTLVAGGQFSRFLIEELVPYIEANYRVSRQANQRALLGASENGVTALALAWATPQVFGVAAAQSPTLDSERGRALIAEVAGARRAKPLAVYHDAGLFEGPILEANRELREALMAAQYRHLYNEVPQGHSWGNWRGHIDDVLAFSFPPAEAAGS